MPKRIVDGDALWRSDKLAQVQPESLRAEFANLIPLALANGSFECNPRLVYSRVYCYNRPDITIETVAQILNELERVGILVRWADDTGKVWGYWRGIDKPGRLPSLSRQEKKHEAVGPLPPADVLNGQPMASHRLANGEVGSGSGSGNGIGNGIGDKPLPRRKHAARDSDVRFSLFIEDLKAYWDEKNPGVAFPFDKSDGSALNKFLRENPKLTQEQFRTCLLNRARSEAVHSERPRVILPNMLRYIGGPLDRYKQPLKAAQAQQLPTTYSWNDVPESARPDWAEVKESSEVAL